MTSSDSSFSKINASVSKSFFVEMLTKDINLPMAVHDLIDNCIDGARKLRGESRFDGLEVDIKLSNTEFSIKDNCGGIDKDTAINYAFRFGRPKEMEGVQHSIGRFGVGMKRAIFKLGRQFSILSNSELNRFEVEVDVPSWEQNSNWEFEFKSLSTVEVPLPVEQRGTTIRVTNLFQSVAEQFSLVYFENNFNKQIASRYQEYLEHGLSIRVNNISIISAPVRYLTYLSNLKATFQEKQYDDVSIRLIVGVGEPKPADAGWYVYCNGRMILRADQSDTTGWGEAGIDRIPRYHNQFARFRGCAYFDSNDPSELPWNTTKDGVDSESGVYRSVRMDMITAMKPVMAFLRELGKEQNEPEGFQPLNQLLKLSHPISVGNITPNDTFKYAKLKTVRSGPRNIIIQYNEPLELVRRVQQRLGVTSARAAGEFTFKYYVKMELEE